MTLTGVPLILLVATATGAAGAATARFWPRGGRLRPLTRTLCVLLLKALVVTTAGLVVNRYQQFYPSWVALAGHTGTISVTRATEAGRLDGYWNVVLDGRVGAEQYGPDGVRAAAEATRYANDALRVAARQTGARYVPTEAAFHGDDGGRDPTGLLAPDGDHPNAAGHAAIAALIPPLPPAASPPGSGPG